MNPGVGENRSQILKTASSGRLRAAAIDRLQIKQGRKLLCLAAHLDIAAENVSRLQIIPPDHGRINVNIIFSWKVIGAADKSIAVCQNL